MFQLCHRLISRNLATLLALVSAGEAQVLIAVDSSRALYSIDPATGVKTSIGTASSNASTSAGLAYDAARRIMYLTSTGNESLFKLDLLTGTATLVGSYGVPGVFMHGLEWDSSTGTLYGASGASSQNAALYKIDTVTGAATLIGLMGGLTSFMNLVHDSNANVLYGTNSGTDSFYRIDRMTGLATLIGALNGPSNPNGLAFAPETNRVYMVDSATDTLYTINVVTGAATAIGSTGTGNLLGLAYIPIQQGGFRRTVHGCGQTTITAGGVPWLGGKLVVTLGSVVGPTGIGIGVAPLGIPFCGCTIGHEWAVSFTGPMLTLNIPNSPALVGGSVLIQGADLQGVGGCASLGLTLTDTMTLVIG